MFKEPAYSRISPKTGTLFIVTGFLFADQAADNYCLSVFDPTVDFMLLSSTSLVV